MATITKYETVHLFLSDEGCMMIQHRYRSLLIKKATDFHKRTLCSADDSVVRLTISMLSSLNFQTYGLLLRHDRNTS